MDFKTPHAGIAISACGVWHFRVRRLAFPRAAFGIPACGVLKKRLQPFISRGRLLSSLEANKSVRQR